MNNGASTSTAAVSEPMDIANEYDTHTSVGNVSEVMDMNISGFDAIKDHWLAADKLFKKVRPQLRYVPT